jgi:hypothetical protein
MIFRHENTESPIQKLTVKKRSVFILRIPIVLDPKEGVCADPVDRAAILGRGGPDPQSRDRERQLTPDKGSGRT